MPDPPATDTVLLTDRFPTDTFNSADAGIFPAVKTLPLHDPISGGHDIVKSVIFLFTLASLKIC